MEANYLNMEGGAWGSSQVGGAANTDPNAALYDTKNPFIGKKKQVLNEQRAVKAVNAFRDQLRNSEDEKKRLQAALQEKQSQIDAVAQGNTSVATALAASRSSDNPVGAPKPNSGSIGDYAKHSTEDIIQYREKLQKMHPGKVAKGLSTYLQVRDGNQLVVKEGQQDALEANNILAMTVQYALQHAKVSDNKVNVDFKYSGDDYDKDALIARLDFLPTGGVGEYSNHLPSSDFIAGLPGALAIANYQPMRLMTPVMSHSLMAQSGGGAIVYSNAPTVRKYCGDANFLAKRVEQQLATLSARNIQLTSNSGKKVQDMIDMLKATEAGLCQAYDQLDAFMGANGEIKPGVKMPGKNTLENIQSNLTDLKARKRRISGQALSTIMTLEDVMYKAAREALKDSGDGGDGAKLAEMK